MSECFTANSDVHKTKMLSMGMFLESSKVMALGTRTTTATVAASAAEFPFRFMRMKEHIADKVLHKLHIFVNSY